MIKFNELQVGDAVIANFEGKQWEGEVTRLNRDDKQVCVDTGVQEFWFESEALQPLPLNEEQLLRFSFQKQESGDGTVKYGKGAFRVQLKGKGDFNDFEIWYREDRRHIRQPISFHEFQNHYHKMTKIPLTRD